MEPFKRTQEDWQRLELLTYNKEQNARRKKRTNLMAYWANILSMDEARLNRMTSLELDHMTFMANDFETCAIGALAFDVSWTDRQFHSYLAKLGKAACYAKGSNRVWLWDLQTDLVINSFEKSLHPFYHLGVKFANEILYLRSKAHMYWCEVEPHLLEVRRLWKEIADLAASRRLAAKHA